MSTPTEERAYYAHPDSNESADAYVCWDCATADERQNPVPDGDAVGEQCARCDVWWDYADGLTFLHAEEGL